MSNALKGSEEMKTPSVRVHAQLLDEFDEWVASSDYDGRSAAFRAFMRDAIDGTPRSDIAPLQPPSEELLADAYLRLCRAAYPNGKVRARTARRICSGGSEQLSKEEVPDLVLHPLRKRGYLHIRSNPFDQDGRFTCWKIVGWEETDAE